MSTMSRIAYILEVLLIGVFLLISGPAAADDDVLAVGKGFEVSQSFVRNMGNFFEQHGLHTSSEELLEGAVRMKLFAIDAKEQGLVDDIPQGSSEQDFKDLMRIQNLYLKNELKKLPVEDRVVQSYYRSYPRRFVQKVHNQAENPENATAEKQKKTTIPDPPWTDEDLMPLDDALKNKIEAIVLQAQQKRISKRLFKKLEKKYDVEYVTK